MGIRNGIFRRHKFPKAIGTRHLKAAVCLLHTGKLNQGRWFLSVVDYAKQACLFNVEAKTNHGYVLAASLRVNNTSTTTRQKLAKNVYSPFKCMG